MSRTSPLHARHREREAKTTGFGGWEMPVRFDSISDEHHAVRDAVGVFDVSHLSRLAVSGPDAERVLQRLTTNDVGALAVGDAHYACILREDGVIIDDIVTYRREGEYLFVPNAGADRAMVERWESHAAEWGHDITVENRTDDTAMLAVQGPDSAAMLDAAAEAAVSDLERYTAREATVHGVGCLVARTGYTGEDGFEVVCAAADAGSLWDGLIEAGVQPCGLGARDTLRLEAGLLLSGQEFDPETEPRTPREARLEFAVAADTEFVGKRGLDDPEELLVGLELDERAVPRHGYPILDDGREVGHVTSGTISPSFDVPIALGYVEHDLADAGTALAVEIRDRAVPATVVERRFLARHRD
jgi:aminomethyltransferase